MFDLLFPDPAFEASEHQCPVIISSDYLLGAQAAYVARIRGHDEVGRVVEAKVRF